MNLYLGGLKNFLTVEMSVIPLTWNHRLSELERPWGSFLNLSPPRGEGTETKVGGHILSISQPVMELGQDSQIFLPSGQRYFHYSCLS